MQMLAANSRRAALRLPTAVFPSAVMMLGFSSAHAEDSTLLIKEQADESLVTVADFAQRPAANMRWLGDRLTLHPKALAGVGFNSNVYGTQTGVVDDAYYRYVAGMQARFDYATTQFVVIDAEFEQKTYQDESSADLTAGRGSALYRHEGPSWNHLAVFHYQRVDDPLIEVGEQVVHDDYVAKVEAYRTGLYARQAFGLEADRVDYLEDTANFSRTQRDNNVYQASATYGVTVDEGSEWNGRVGPKAVRYDSDELYNDSMGGFAGLGGKRRLGGRSSVSGEFGLEYRQYDDDFADNPEYDDRTVMIPAGKLRFLLSWEDGSDIHAGIYSRIEDSLSSNAAWKYGAEAGGVYRLLLNARAYADVGYIESRDSGAALGAQTEQREYSFATLGLIYSLRDGVSVRVAGKYVDSTALVGPDYDRMTATVDIAAVF